MNDKPSSAQNDEAITETAAYAKKLLFDREGKLRQEMHAFAATTFYTVLRDARDERLKGLPAFCWRGKHYVYDSAWAEVFLEGAHAGDEIYDQVLCNAAAVMLDATGGIPNDRLRTYVIQRLNKDIPPPRKKGRGRSADPNRYRDFVIAGCLIPSLLRKGFLPTRNAATKDLEKAECACSIVSKALKRIGICLSEKRIVEIWAKVSRFSKLTQVPNN